MKVRWEIGLRDPHAEDGITVRSDPVDVSLTVEELGRAIEGDPVTIEDGTITYHPRRDLLWLKIYTLGPDAEVSPPVDIWAG